MSLEASGWAWGQNVPGNQKLVLLALADFMHGKADGCWASLDYLAAKCSIGRSTCQRALKRLQSANLVEIEARGNRTNIYRLKVEPVPKEADGQSDHPISDGQSDHLRWSIRPPQMVNMTTSDGQSDHLYSNYTVTNTDKDTGMGDVVKAKGKVKGKEKRTESTERTERTEGTKRTEKTKENKRGGASKKKASATVPLPTSLRLPDIIEAWGEYVKMRNQKKKPMGDFAAKLILRKLERMGPVDALTSLHASITAGWTDVYEPKEGGIASTKQNGSMSVWEAKTRISAIEEEIRAVENRGYTDAWGVQLKAEDKKERRDLLRKKREVMKWLIQS